jgi:hypothetical protein
MSETKTSINERKIGRENEVPDEKLMLPDEVYDANWYDDIVEEADDETEEETSLEFEDYDKPQEYVSPEEVSADAQEKIRAFELYKNVGSKTLRVYGRTA